jgi:hypothetical protein
MDLKLGRFWKYEVTFWNNPSEKLDGKILRKYARQYIDDIFVELGEQPSIHLKLINIDVF